MFQICLSWKPSHKTHISPLNFSHLTEIIVWSNKEIEKKVIQYFHNIVVNKGSSFTESCWSVPSCHFKNGWNKILPTIYLFTTQRCKYSKINDKRSIFKYIFLEFNDKETRDDPFDAGGFQTHRRLSLNQTQTLGSEECNGGLMKCRKSGFHLLIPMSAKCLKHKCDCTYWNFKK